jgi:ubiquinone/menaquinone biosynthesis C-methylase UbiE
MQPHIHSHESPAQTEGRLIRWASFYDATVNLMTLGHAGLLRNLTVDKALLRPGESILDIGCGTGGLTIPAKTRVGEKGVAAGIDPAPEMIAVARRKAERAGLEIDFRVSAVEALPFADGTFDVVTSSLMMHHLSRQLQIQGLAEVRRVLKPGGRVFIADMLRPSESRFKRFLTSMVFHHGHLVDSGLEDLLQLLRDAGFEGVEQLNERFLVIGVVRAKKPA